MDKLETEPPGLLPPVVSRFLSHELEAVLGGGVARDSAQASLSLLYRLYYRLRPHISVEMRQRLQSRLPNPSAADWYIPRATFEELLQLVADHGPFRLLHPWPGDHDWCFVPTHDVESGDGMRTTLRIAEIEEELGFRSAWNFVPYSYRVDPGILDELANRGFEVAVHGYNHDGRLYESRETFTSRVAAINEALTKYHAVGFRSPMVHRNLEWLQQLDIEYDASFFDIDPYQAMPGGVGGIWPFIAGKFVELPYTIPQDHTLFIARKEKDDRIWRDKLAFLARNSGMALMVTHPDYLMSDEGKRVYRDFLTHVAEHEGFWRALPRDVARWWREREAAQAALTAGEAVASPRATVAELRVAHGDLTFERLLGEERDEVPRA